MQRIFSGIQPSGVPHLGNYLGAMRNWVTLQDGHECIYCVVDLHAITVWQDPKLLPQQTREMTASLLAIGIDAKRHILFNQSAVPAHVRLAWIFNCVARMGWLNRMTQFKDKAGKDRENVSTGLFVYPNLMAADILAYRATRVPVGDDQRQHLELANDIAQKFNHDYGTDFFPTIEPVIMEVGARVMSLRDGTKKMSKSDASEQSRINLTDDADAIALKIRRAKTDPEPLPTEPAGLDGRPEARNLVGIYAALAGTDLAGVLREHGGRGFGAFKEALTERLIAHLAPIAAETRRWLDDPGAIEAVLRDGAARAAAIANPIVDEAERLVGLLKP
jgi:tryptophanyl-tRNA synthetase